MAPAVEGVGVLSDISALPGQQKSQKNLPRKGEHVRVTEALLPHAHLQRQRGNAVLSMAFSGNNAPGDTLLLVINKDAVNTPAPPGAANW